MDKKKVLIALIVLGLLLSIFTLIAGAHYVGSKNSDVYHDPSCHYVDRITPENLIYFDTPEDAIAAGYRPCKVCKPPTKSSTTSTPTPTVEVPDPMKAWVVANYGDGTRVTSDSADKLIDAMMMGTLAPLPAGYTKADITEELYFWAKNNPNWTIPTPTPSLSAPLPVHNLNTGENFSTIQAAIDDHDTKDGHTITVYSGVYYENVVVDKSVTLIGNGQPVVDASGWGSAITLTADGITLIGFTATNSGREMDAGITVTSSSNIITGNNASNNDDGISFWHSSNNIITGNDVRSNNDDGIYLLGSSSNSITGNNVSNSYNGICLEHSNNNTITGNTFFSNGIGIYLSPSSNSSITCNKFVNDGLRVSFSYQNTVEDNIVNGRPLVYLEDVADYKVEDAGQVILVNCSNITVENLDLSNTHVGIELWETEDSIISNNTLCNNYHGVSLWNSSNNIITGNDVRSNNDDGIGLSLSSNNIITGNNVSNSYNGICLEHSNNNNTLTGNNVRNNNDVGIFLSLSSNNIITGNNVRSNGGGIYLLGSSNNIITGNDVRSNNYKGINLFDSNNKTIRGNTFFNNGIGIYLFYSSNNKIYFNNLINNTDNVDSPGSTNIWNSPLVITYTYEGNAYTNYLGNYWDGYEGTDAEGDGIGDTHYSIDSDSDESDDYPLMKPFEYYFA